MNVQINRLWYNPENSAFEGRIDIRRGGKSFRYPCAVQGPMDMSPGEVRRRMEAQAMRMSDTPSLYSHI